MTLVSLMARILRDPASVVSQAEDADAFARLAPALLVILAGGAAIFGGVIGSYRGGIQLAFAALKMPLLFLIPVLLTLPAVRALWASCGVEVSWNRVAMAGLVGMARAAVLAAASSPVVWLLLSLEPSYHVAVLWMAVALCVIGPPGIGVVAGAAPVGGRRRFLATVGSVALLGLCTMQTGWLLRPFVARPTAEVTFLRAVEADIFSALGATSRSARGDYSQKWRE